MRLRATVGMGVLLSVLAATGCASSTPPLTEVKGVVLLDGKPLAGVRVEFIPGDSADRRLPFSQAETDDNGRYELRCENTQPGAVIGQHKVIVRRPSIRPAPDAPPPPSGPAIPVAYQSVLNTPLTVDVKADQKSYDLVLKSK